MVVGFEYLVEFNERLVGDFAGMNLPCAQFEGSSVAYWYQPLENSDIRHL